MKLACYCCALARFPIVWSKKPRRCVSMSLAWRRQTTTFSVFIRRLPSLFFLRSSCSRLHSSRALHGRSLVTHAPSDDLCCRRSDQGTTTEDEWGKAVVKSEDDDSCVVALRFSESWHGPNDRADDFAAVKVDSSRQQVWRWEASMDRIVTIEGRSNRSKSRSRSCSNTGRRSGSTAGFHVV